MSDSSLNKKLYEKIAGKIKKGLERNEEDPRLIDVSNLSDFSDVDLKTILSAFYETKDPIYQRVGTILNSIFTHGHNVFIISKGFLNELMVKDTNYPANTCDTKTYKRVLKTMYDDQIIECLRKPVRNDRGVAGKTGLYEVVDKDMLTAMSKTVGENTLLAKREQFIQWFDEKNPEQDQYVLTPQDREMLRKGKEKADEIFGRKPNH